MTEGAVFEGVSSREQLAALEARALDPRPTIASGWAGLDQLLHRGGLQSGLLAIVAGRPHTRKTTVTLNLVLNMLEKGVAVGLTSLDEPLPSYVAKLMSASFHVPADFIESNWETDKVKGLRVEYEENARNLSMTRGTRPSLEDLSQWLAMSDIEYPRPQVVFIDYLSMLSREKFDGAELQRVSRLFERLKEWALSEDVLVVALHHAGRSDDGTQRRNHGSVPMTAESLRYAGDDAADLVFGCYRPALDVLGQMDHESAETIYGEDFDEDKWEKARERVSRYEKSTLFQLLKNRPGTHLDFQGVELVSPDESQYMLPAADSVGPDMRRTHSGPWSDLDKPMSDLGADMRKKLEAVK